MAAMAAASCPATALPRLTGAERAEMAGLCAACPRTDACRLWLVAHAGTPTSAAPDFCPNHARLRALAGDRRLA